MADVQFDTPTDAPTAQNSAPYTRFLQYKSGKTPEGFASKAAPADVKAGFSYYDKDTKEVVKVENFTACIVAVLSGVTGTVRNGDRYDNYYSNMVFDTRDQFLNVRQFGIDKVLYSGLYKDIKHQFPQGVGFTQFLIAYIYGTGEVVSIELTAGLSAAIQNAIAKTVGTTKKISLFNLCDISTRFWCLKFTDEFEKKDKEGNPHTGKGEMYFMPKIQVFEVRAEKNASFVETLAGISDDVRAYVGAGQDKMRATAPNASAQAAAPQYATAGDEHFPPDDTAAPAEGEDLDLPF